MQQFLKTIYSQTKKSTRIAGGISFSGIALVLLATLGVRLSIGLPAMQLLPTTHKMGFFSQGFSLRRSCHEVTDEV